MDLRLGRVGDEARRVDHDVDSQVLPGQVAGIPLGKDLHPCPVHPQVVALGGDVTLKIAEDRVVLEEVGQGPRIRDVVDRDDLEVAPAQGGAVDIAPNAAKPIDANLHRHDASPRYWGMPSSGSRGFPRTIY